MKNPIDNIEWVDVNELSPNDYNPNVVYNKELELLEFSILKNGWIQPILVNIEGDNRKIIIDGFHRHSLAKRSKRLQERFGKKVPVAYLTLSTAERMLLTIRINRAKGSHIAYKMSDIIKTLVEEYSMPISKIMKEIGATKDEVDLLLMNDVFKKLDIQNHKYSRAWYPR